MDATDKIRTRCPVCRSKYMVAAALVGHRARCRKCKQTFLVAEDHRFPTEDDILRWLNEGTDDYEFANHPRIIKGGVDPHLENKVGGVDPNLGKKVGALDQSGLANTPSLDVHSKRISVKVTPDS